MLTFPLLGDDSILALERGLGNDASRSGGHAYLVPLFCEPPFYLCWFPIMYQQARKSDPDNIHFLNYHV